MQSNFNTTQTTSAGPTTRQSETRARLESARKTIRHAQHTIHSNEGRLLDYETSDGLWNALQQAIKEIESVTISMAVMERKGR